MSDSAPKTGDQVGNVFVQGEKKSELKVIVGVLVAVGLQPLAQKYLGTSLDAVQTTGIILTALAYLGARWHIKVLQLK